MITRSAAEVMIRPERCRPLAYRGAGASGHTDRRVTLCTPSAPTTRSARDSPPAGPAPVAPADGVFSGAQMA
jgi:hypothetical protein